MALYQQLCLAATNHGIHPLENWAHHLRYGSMNKAEKMQINEENVLEMQTEMNFKLLLCE